MTAFILDWLEARGIGAETAELLVRVVLLVCTLLLAYAAYLVARRLLVAVIRRVIRKSKTERDDIFVERRVFHHLAHLAPAEVIDTMMDRTWGTT